MIFSNLSDISNYTYLNSSLRKALRFLKNNNLSKLDNDRYEIDSDRIFAIINESIPKSINDIIWETHDQYADIHFVIKGEEKIGISNVNNLESISEYIPEKDATFYKGEGQFIILKENDFLILFPKEVHAAGLKSGECSLLKKIVIKIKIYNN